MTAVVSMSLLASTAPNNTKFMDDLRTFCMGYASESVVPGYEWASLGRGTVVEVGGADGRIALEVASQCPSIQFIVQGHASTAAQAKSSSSKFDSSVSSRVQWMAHDYLEPQPTECKGAEAYLVQCSGRGWTDEYVAKVFGNVAAAMGPESKLLIADDLVPLDGASTTGQGRTTDDWTQLLAMSDSRLVIARVVPPSRPGEVSVIEARRVSEFHVSFGFA
ncbi:hypothetical protein B0I35DRAFT_405045 [Stachybotrys elegans]|uniref:O-methyltransferase C-terminal domain-containing protein n=1 Tax=Stachybotrys elegans TaxID=80388 RepID=A0A8K0T288_9HYPO|nr:hypothetical protein B0I35DRAFT_405045 [Stachybotrys elegans]